MTLAPPIELEEPRSTREQVLDAAERLFAERGFAGVSMRDIVAETALKNQASLYHHFRNKRALYEAVLARGVEAIMALVPERGSGTRSDVNRNVDRTLDYLSQHPHLARLIQRAALDDSRYMRRALGSILRPLYSQSRRALAGQEEAWAQDELPHLAAGLYLLIFGYFANAELIGSIVGADALSPEAVERQRRFLKAAVARLLGVRPNGE
ncbi:MAG: TetR/AcrR family transcriptional regulator [Chloroflexi bacterium]|nr:MAG: TetR/AcrR family transcriptional regulator [Chloroflexota bacterium]